MNENLGIVPLAAGAGPVDAFLVLVLVLAVELQSLLFVTFVPFADVELHCASTTDRDKKQRQKIMTAAALKLHCIA